MDGGEDVFLHYSFGNDDSILEVVAFPRHEGNLHIATECQLAVFGGVAFGEHLSFHHLVALADDGFDVDAGVLVGSSELLEVVGLFGGVETDEILCLGAVVLDDDLGGIGVEDDTVVFGAQESAGVDSDLSFEAGAHDGGFRIQQRHGLTHHVRAHQGTVSIVVLQERDQGGGDGGDLVRCHVDQVDLFLRHNREVGEVTCLHHSLQHTVFIHGCAGLCDGLVLFLFGAEVDGRLVELDGAVNHLAVGGFDETEVVDLCKDAEGGDQTDVRTFRGLDGAQTAIVRVVHVTDLEACSLTGQTARTEGGDTALVRQLRQRVGLVHEL